MRTSKNSAISVLVDETDAPTEETTAADALNQALYERVCELLEDSSVLSSVLQQLATDGSKIGESRNDLAELILSDNSEVIGRHVIDHVIQVTWALAERELGTSFSENPGLPNPKESRTH